MSKFHFDENIITDAATNLKSAAANFEQYETDLSKAVFLLLDSEGFNIGYAIERIGEETSKKLPVCKKKLEDGHGFICAVKERITMYDQLAASQNALNILERGKTGNLGNEFDKFREGYSLFVKEDVDFKLLSKVIIAEGTNAGKMGLTDLIECIRKGDWGGIFDNNASKQYSEYYIAKYLENVYTNVSFDNSVLKDTDELIKLAVSDPSKIADLLSKLNIDANSKLGKLLTETLKIANADQIKKFQTTAGKAHEAVESEQIKLLGTTAKVSDYVVGLIKEMITDYSKTLESIDVIRNSLEYSNDRNQISKYLDELYDKYSKSSLERASEYMQHYAEKEVSSLIYGKTLGKYTALVDIPADYLKAMDNDIENYLELRYTDGLSSQLADGYKNLSEKIMHGNYTADDLRQCSETFEAMKDLYIYRYEHMIEITDSSERKAIYSQQLEELRNMTL